MIRDNPQWPAPVGQPALEAGGGDTWSAVQPFEQSTYSMLQSASSADSPESAPGAAFEGSEGGDTWSRFLPRLQGQPMGFAGLSSAPRFEQR